MVLLMEVIDSVNWAWVWAKPDAWERVLVARDLNRVESCWARRSLCWRAMATSSFVGAGSEGAVVS